MPPDLIRVVVVDDVIEVRRLLRSTLRFGGEGRFAVVGDAATAAEAVAVTERLQPQIVVLDLGLPDLSGQELVGRIREAAPYAKVVVFTGSDLEGPDDEEWFARRTAGYVHKDRLDSLVDTLVAISDPPAEGSTSFALPRDPLSLAIARERVRIQLHAWSLPGVVDEAVLVVSELTANAVEHARSGFEVRLQLRDARVLRIEVADQGPGSPDPAGADELSERGRGLLLVSSVADSWGVHTTDDDGTGEDGGRGKTVWAELPIEPPPRSSP